MDKALIVLLFVGTAWGQMLQGVSTSKPPTAAITFAELQHPGNYSCASATTCSVTLTTGITAGSLLVIQAMATNRVYPVSINVGGTLIPVYSSNAFSSGNTKNIMQAYVCSATSTAGPVVVTFNGTTGGSRVELREFSVTGGCNGNVVLDSASGSVNAGGSTFNGETQTVNGTNDVLAQFNNSKDTTVTSVASPWNTNADFDPSGDGYARKINTTVGTAPSWVGDVSSSFDATSAIAIGAGTTACNDENFLDFSGGTNGSNLATATLNSSTVGPTFAWGSASGTPAGSETFSTSAYKALLSSYRTCSGGKTGTGGTLGMKFDVSASTNYFFPFPLFAANGANPSTSVSYGFWYQTHVDTADTGYYSMNMIQDLNGLDFMSLMGHTGELYLEAKTDTNGNPLICTGSSCNGNNKFSYTADTWYWITGQMNKYVANGTSSTSLAIGTGSKSFTTTAGLGYTAGQAITAYNSASNWMGGTVSSYSGTTLVISVTNTGGSGTLASWTFTGSVHKMSIYDASGTLLVAMQKSSYPTTPTNPDQFDLGRVGDSGTTAGDYIYISNVRINLAGTFPLVP